MKKRGILYYSFIAIISLWLFSCAQQGAPIGGPEDVTPPRILNSKPKNYSTNFSAEKIMITFDEYLNTGNFTQELVVSPPMEEKPVVKMRGKTLIIEFEEELKEDVTYTFNFGSGIKDLNEGNELLNYEYVFSTGDYLDSLSIKGTLKIAEDLSIPEIPIFVMLYTENRDSLPLIEIPYYVGRTDKAGNFAVNNLKPDDYKLFVLKDANNNFLFDLPTEKIAFLDSTVKVDAEYFQDFLLGTGVYDSTDLEIDTSFFSFDTTGMTEDSIAMIRDSLQNELPDFNSIWVDLFMFQEEDMNQFISEYEREEREMFNIIFNKPLTDSFSYDVLYPPSLTKEGIIEQMGINRDTLTIWAADTTVASYDTIGISLKYMKLDTLELSVWSQDTIFFSYREKSSGRKPGKASAAEAVPKLKVETIRNGGKQPLHRDLVFLLQEPVKEVNPELFEFFSIQDTLEIPETIIPTIDTNHIARIRYKKKWKEEGSYRLVLYPGAITSVYEITHDTIDLKFSTKPVSDYARINLDLQNVEDSVIIQVIRSDRIIRQQAVIESATYVFENLDPATYRFKFIHDRNGNGKWDTGEYMSGLQPERVEYLPKDLKVRANWDHNIEYIIGSNTEAPKAPETPAADVNRNDDPSLDPPVFR